MWGAGSDAGDKQSLDLQSIDKDTKKENTKIVKFRISKNSPNSLKISRFQNMNPITSYKLSWQYVIPITLRCCSKCRQILNSRGGGKKSMLWRRRSTTGNGSFTLTCPSSGKRNERECTYNKLRCWYCFVHHMTLKNVWLIVIVQWTWQVVCWFLAEFWLVQ